MDLDVPTALDEVTSKSDPVIERETSAKWASRAVACYCKFAETGDAEWLMRAEDYKHEALEHAAMCEDGGATVAEAEEAMASGLDKLCGMKAAQ